MSTTTPIKSFEDVQRLKNHFLEKGEHRNHLLVSVCLNTALRIGDVLALRWDDILNDSRRIRDYIILTEAKTGKTAVIRLNNALKTAVRLYIENTDRHTGFVFMSRNNRQLSRSMAFRIIRDAGRAIDLEYDISPHSLRKTFGYHAWKKGTPPAMLMQIYNHSRYDITKRYLGITQDDKDKVFMTVNL